MFHLVIGFLISTIALNTYSSINVPQRFSQIRSEIKEMATLRHSQQHGYKRARKFIMQKIHLQEDRDGFFVFDVYCNDKFRRNVGPSDMPDHKRLNIEHTWPRSRFGVNEGTKKFSQMEADLHHLFPTNSVANSTRGSYKFSQFQISGVPLFECEASKKGYITRTGDDGFEPPAQHKGNVARALFYMAVRYDLRISADEEFFLRQWNIMDPVDEEEIRRNDKIEEIQGNRNPFIDDPELAEIISDF